MVLKDPLKLFFSTIVYKLGLRLTDEKKNIKNAHNNVKKMGLNPTERGRQVR